MFVPGSEDCDRVRSAAIGAFDRKARPAPGAGCGAPSVGYVGLAQRYCAQELSQFVHTPDKRALAPVTLNRRRYTLAIASATSAQCSRAVRLCSIWMPWAPPMVSRLTMLHGSSPPRTSSGSATRPERPSQQRPSRSLMRSPPSTLPPPFRRRRGSRCVRFQNRGRRRRGRSGGENTELSNGKLPGSMSTEVMCQVSLAPRRW